MKLKRPASKDEEVLPAGGPYAPIVCRWYPLTVRLSALCRTNQAGILFKYKVGISEV